MIPVILVVEDEPVVLQAICRIFEKTNYKIETAKNLNEGIEKLETIPRIHLILLDVKLPDGNGLELIEVLKHKYYNKHKFAESIIITGLSDIKTAVKATQMGAYYFISKPFHIEEMQMLTSKVIEHIKLNIENNILKEDLMSLQKNADIIGRNSKLMNILQLISKVAKNNATVLITGESGTGKELVAKAIHANSSRNFKPFVTINCGAIPEDLLESELFGHTKGSFTGAIKDHIGKFKKAQGGTLFLDEVGELPLSLQVKLLRVLQEKEFEPVGSGQTIKSDTRIIAATNKDLEIEIKNKSFRKDLFYRLNVIPIKIPPLRDRIDDIEELTQSFIKKHKSPHSKIEKLTPRALETLKQYNWPGNIRELENIIERLSIIVENKTVSYKDLPQNITHAKPQISRNVSIPDQGVDFKQLINEYELKLISKALEKTNGNRKKAALLLNLNRTTLIEKIKKKGIFFDNAPNP